MKNRIFNFPSSKNLARVKFNNSFPFSKKKRKCTAFTLAEVLITLTILGVVAAVTIPSIINHYEQRVTVTKVKKMYSILETALGEIMAQNNNENIDFNRYSRTNAGAKNIFDDFIKPYVKINYDAGTNKTNKQKIMDCNAMTTLDGTEWDANYCTNNKYYAAQLKDGSTLIIRGADSIEGQTPVIYFSYDVNGEKGPNTLGKDIFPFCIRKTAPREILFTKSEEFGINNMQNGWLATEYIIRNGNMDYLKCKGTYDFVTNECN